MSSKRTNQVIYVSATPANYEKNLSTKIVEQIIRPTGLVDPTITVKPVKGQIDDLLYEIGETTKKGFRTLVTTLTKKMAEDLTKYMDDMGIRVKYLHSDIDTLERLEIIRDLRMGEFDVLVGINLLREGLDLPEVALVAILDADKQGFLRSETSLIQTIGRAARNVEGRVIMYADTITTAMEKALGETNRRRKIQEQYNKEHNITPRSIQKAVHNVIEATKTAEDADIYKKSRKTGAENLDKSTLKAMIDSLTKDMRKAARELEFEQAAVLRDQIEELKRILNS